MAKLYRIVPDSTATLITERYYTNTNEDLLYNLNCFSPYNNGYLSLYDYNTGITGENRTKSLFFFTSPWSCIKALKYFNEFSNQQAKILEYDIPDEIVNQQTNVITNYTNYQAKGKLIPVELLKSQKSISIPDISSNIEKMTITDIYASLEKLCSSDVYPYKKCLEFVLVRSCKIQQRKKENLNNVFHSDYITGKSIIITLEDYYNLFNNDIEKLQQLITSSNGIFTEENLSEYDFDTPEHTYGLIL